MQLCKFQSNEGSVFLCRLNLKENTAEGTIMNHQGTLLNNHLILAYQPHIKSTRTQNIVFINTQNPSLMKVMRGDVRQLMGISTKTSLAQNNHGCMLSIQRRLTSWPKGTNIKLQQPMLLFFFYSYDSITQDALTPMQIKCSYLLRKWSMARVISV